MAHWALNFGRARHGRPHRSGWKHLLRCLHRDQTAGLPPPPSSASVRLSDYSQRSEFAVLPSTLEPKRARTRQTGEAKQAHTELDLPTPPRAFAAPSRCQHTLLPGHSTHQVVGRLMASTFQPTAVVLGDNHLFQPHRLVPELAGFRRPHLSQCIHRMVLESQPPHKIVNLLFQSVN